MFLGVLFSAICLLCNLEVVSDSKRNLETVFSNYSIFSKEFTFKHPKNP